MINTDTDRTIGASAWPFPTISSNSAPQLEFVDEQKDLIDCVDEMISAIRNGKSVQMTASNLEKKSWWGAFKGTVSGANDKDLATMVKNLGGSLETTQMTVQVMLRIQTRKDHVLRGFHSALVDKIVKIQADTKTLDVNQRTAALDIVAALIDQVEDQLRQCDAVDRHEKRLQEIDGTLVNSASVEADFRENLKALDDQCANLKKSDNYLSHDVEVLQAGLKDLATKSETDLTEAEHKTSSLKAELYNLDMKFTENVNLATAAQTQLHESIIYFQQEMKSGLSNLSGRIDHQNVLIVKIEGRLIQIETELARSLTWPARLRRHSFGLAGILIGIAGLTIPSLR